jgi:hypothetical protein
LVGKPAWNVPNNQKAKILKSSSSKIAKSLLDIKTKLGLESAMHGDMLLTDNIDQRGKNTTVKVNNILFCFVV